MVLKEITFKNISWLNKTSLALALLAVIALFCLSGCIGDKKVITVPGGHDTVIGVGGSEYEPEPYNPPEPVESTPKTRTTSGGKSTGAGRTVNNSTGVSQNVESVVTGDVGASEAARGTRPYTVMGKTYYPLLSVDSYSEEGIASWYGRDFHGKKTANGERYDMYGLTAAHKILPFGTKVKVTSLDSGKSVVVRVNDRGPFVDNRIIDLTYTGAKQIDMLDAGTARVRLETIGAVQGLKDGELKGRFYVQVGAFSKEENAVRLIKTLNDRGFKARRYFSKEIKFWRVQVGPYDELTAVERAADQLRSEFAHCFIVAE